jgi:RNA polymerase sigma-70 factor (ECF subfamily)
MPVVAIAPLTEQWPHIQRCCRSAHSDVAKRSPGFTIQRAKQMTGIATMVDAVEHDLDRDLVEQCLAGHPEQFRPLVRRYERVVAAHLRTRMRNAGAVEDAAQETFVRAYQNLAKLRSHDAFFSWLLGIADRVARESWRRQRRHEEVCQAYLQEQRRAPQLGDPGERDMAIESAMVSLSEPLRQVVLLRFYSDQSCAEIALALRIPIGTVTKRLSRAYAHIRRHLDR